ncbi:DUF6456 domain-containing protein [Sinisalibacter aestuarii]|uniref:Helix-turn-helix domain-containing protein n=1 Tax=Sinisalibacter aestuarii TaxID=2949426 RepID=A0ABQ5LSE3_9RHOB|nr:DUF6456 domain-containing protein [Sinisalibacter aestuarii]GKY87658.1 hypothetical protein STA1M1_15270 [Sinisalibacter aestuarii]
MGNAQAIGALDAQVRLPGWVPQEVRVYLAHTEAGESIRSIARALGHHPSTVLRQVRRTETLRDDPLADSGLARLGRLVSGAAGQSLPPSTAQDHMQMKLTPEGQAMLARDTLRVLRAMMAPRSLLVIADGVDDAVVVQDTGGDRPVRRAVLGRDLAEVLALREFIAGTQTGRLTRYHITAAGRAEAGRLMAESESRRSALLGAAEDAGRAARADRPIPVRRRSAGTDAPYYVLSRRRRADGEAWLPPALIAAAARFRETWEIAQIGADATRAWAQMMAAGGRGRAGGAAPGAPTRRLEAEAELQAAMRVLGPDLAETLILGVCREEGMEDIENRLDFPARSGKIVLRIALRRLARHYADTGSGGFDMIS